MWLRRPSITQVTFRASDMITELSFILFALIKHHCSLQQSVPMRHKEFHCVNVPGALKYIVDFAVSKVTPKMAERLNVSFK